LIPKNTEIPLAVCVSLHGDNSSRLAEILRIILFCYRLFFEFHVLANSNRIVYTKWLHVWGPIKYRNPTIQLCDVLIVLFYGYHTHIMNCVTFFACRKLFLPQIVFIAMSLVIVFILPTWNLDRKFDYKQYVLCVLTILTQ